MQVILLEKVVNLGGLGDVVKVKEGFARNYLIPHGKAKRATPENLKEFESRRAELEKAQAEALSAAQERGAKIDGADGPDRAEGGGRRPAVRLGDHLRYRRGAAGAGPRGRARSDPAAAGAAQAGRRLPDRRRAARATWWSTSPCRSWASRRADFPPPRCRPGVRLRRNRRSRVVRPAVRRAARVESSRGSHSE